MCSSENNVPWVQINPHEGETAKHDPGRQAEYTQYLLPLWPRPTGHLTVNYTGDALTRCNSLAKKGAKNPAKNEGTNERTGFERRIK